MLSQRYERGSTLVTSNLPFQEWTEVLGSERLTGALLDRLTHHAPLQELHSGISEVPREIIFRNNWPVAGSSGLKMSFAPSHAR